MKDSPESLNVPENSSDDGFKAGSERLKLQSS